MICGAVVVAAGRSARMGFNKIMAPLAGQPVVFRVLKTFGSVSEISYVVTVANSDNLSELEMLVDSLSYHTPIDLCLGGETRLDSVHSGVNALPDNVDLVLVHDAARPLVTQELISTAVAAGQEFGAAIAAIPVTDTIKVVDDGQIIKRTVDRGHLYAAQTPQVFRRDWLNTAYERVQSHSDHPVFTDEASLLEWAGFEVRVFAGSGENIKLTAPVDLMLAESILAQRQTVTH